jgi:catechol 2,3-dioxygenase-like lactoylglutathione lyase family enzyme
VADFPAPAEGIVLTHFLVSGDVDRSRAFYTEVLGGEAVMEGEPTIVALANSWIIINTGGGPNRRQTLDHARGPARPGPGQRVPEYPCCRYRRRIRRLVGQGRAVPHRADRSWPGDPLLPA